MVNKMNNQILEVVNLNPLLQKAAEDGSVFSIPNQLISIIVSTILTVILVFTIYYFVRKQDPNKKPGIIFTIMESYLLGFENLMISITDNRLKKAYPYFFTLFNFILINTFLSLLGFYPANSSIMFTFTLGLITFIGIYVVGIATHGLIHFAKHKYANPLELFAQFAPLLSISIRLFGATLATSIIGELFPIIFEGVGLDNLATIYPIISIPYSWVWTFIDLALGVIQAFVFVVLTALYWSLEHGPSWNRKERKEYYKAEKEVKKKIRKENKEKNNS